MNFLLSTMKLSFSPMTIYEFDKFREDKDIYNYLTTANIYVIAKRPLPTMKLINGCGDYVHLEVEMAGIDSKLEILITKDNNKELFKEGLTAIRTGNNTTNNEIFHSITLYRGNEEFIFAANLDRLIHLHSNKYIKLAIKGDVEPFITYEVLYVGQCTGQHIFERFKSHHALQEILINENIIPPNYQMVNDLIMLPFYVSSDLISTIDGNTSFDEFEKILTGNHGIEEKTISLDCEKALVKAMNPKYNKQKFASYPKSKDGLYSHNLNEIRYQIQENLLLKYEKDFIYGDITLVNASTISVFENEDFYIF